MSEKKALYPIPALWAYINWYLSRDIPFNIILNEYKRRAAGTGPPYTFLALINDIPAGMVTLKESDLSSRKDLSPWLSALYVVPEFRNQGIGNDLLKFIIHESLKAGHRELYLFIDNRNRENLKKYYTKRGWKYFDSSPGPDGAIAEIYSSLIEPSA